MEWWPDWLSDWQAWLAAAMALAVVELLSLDLILLMLAGGAVIGMLAALVGLPVAVQVAAAAVTSVAMLALVRPSIVKRMHPGPELRLGHQALVGRQGLVVDAVSANAGQIRIGGELWTARPYDGSSVIEAGAQVDVLEIRGATALVHEAPTLER